MSKTSGDLWPMIRLYGPDGTKLEEDGGNPAELSYKLLSSGTYTILAYDYHSKNQAGDYNIYAMLTAGTPDTIAPDTEITYGPSGTISYNHASFGWTGSDDETQTTNLVFSYYLEGYDKL